MTPDVVDCRCRCCWWKAPVVGAFVGGWTCPQYSEVGGHDSVDLIEVNGQLSFNAIELQATKDAAFDFSSSGNCEQRCDVQF